MGLRLAKGHGKCAAHCGRPFRELIALVAPLRLPHPHRWRDIATDCLADYDAGLTTVIRSILAIQVRLGRTARKVAD